MGAEGLEYAADLVLCIDRSESMRATVSALKVRSISLLDDYRRIMARLGRPVATLRVKIITFGDLYQDYDNSIMASEFFTLPKERAEFDEISHALACEI